MTKIGCKRSMVKAYPMKRTPIKKVSKKQAKENAELKKLTDKLRELRRWGDSDLYISELSKEPYPSLDPHHLAGRGKKGLLNPFFIVMCARVEHDWEQKHMSYEHKQELINKIRPIRISQGFKEEDYK